MAFYARSGEGGRGANLSLGGEGSAEWLKKRTPPSLDFRPASFAGLGLFGPRRTEESTFSLFCLENCLFSSCIKR